MDQISSVASSSSYNSNFTSITGTYGTLKVGADGTYTYVADQSASDDLDAQILQQIVLLIQYRMEQLLTLQH